MILHKATLILAFSAYFFHVSATHFVGGELNYKLINSITLEYEVELSLYRDCLGVLFNDQYDIYLLHKNGLDILDTITLNKTNNHIIENTIPPNSNCLVIPPEVCVEKYIYKVNTSFSSYDSLRYLFFASTARNQGIVNIKNNDLNLGYSLFVEIPDLTTPVINSNPKYNNIPPIGICISDTFRINQSAIDFDGDSLVYELCSPYSVKLTNPSDVQSFDIQLPQPATEFASGFSFLNPFGSNGFIEIDSVTGHLMGKCNVEGRYLVGICVKEYRNGELLTSHLRDFQFNVTDCVPVSAAEFTIANCGDTVIFNNKSLGAETYLWDFGDTTTTSDTSTLKTPTYFYPDTGTYTVRLIINPNHPCVDTSFSEVIIQPYQKARIYFPFDTVCLGETLQFYDSSAVSGDSISWLWNFGDNSGFATNDDTSNQQNPIYTYESFDFFNNKRKVTLEIFTEFECITKDSIELVVLPPFTQNFQKEYTNCSDSTINFEYGGHNDVDSILWNFGDNTTLLDTSTSYTASYKYPDTGQYNGYLVLYSSSDHPCKEDTVDLSIGIGAPISVFINPSGGCVNDTIQFIDSSDVPINQIEEWSWELESGVFASSQDTSYIYDEEGTYLVGLTIYSKYGCINSNYTSITIAENPVSDAGEDILSCGDSTIRFLNNSQLNAGQLWDFGDTNILSDTSLAYQPAYTYRDTGLYNVTLITYSSNDCPSDTDIISVSIKHGIIASFISDSICLGDSILLKNQSKPQIHGSNFQSTWIVNQQDTFFEKNIALSPDSSGEYIISLHVLLENGCTDSISSIAIVYDSIQPLYLQNSIICENDTLCLSLPNAQHPFINYEYFWEPAPDSIFACYVAKESDSIYLTIKDVNTGCSYSDSMFYIVNDLPEVISVPNYIKIERGEEVTPQASGALTYVWTPEDETISLNSTPSPIIQTNYNNKYIVTGMDENGCIGRDTLIIEVESDPQILVPNAFSPGSSINPVLNVIYWDIERLLSFSIYNRWGDKIFETNNMNEGWDGTNKVIDQEVGAYTYIINAVDFDQSLIQQEGVIILLR